MAAVIIAAASVKANSCTSHLLPNRAATSSHTDPCSTNVPGGSSYCKWPCNIYLMVAALKGGGESPTKTFQPQTPGEFDAEI